MIITREWAMPSKHTFLIKPIGDLLLRWLKDRPESADAFAGFNSPARSQNDLNPEAPTKWHLEAERFAAVFPDHVLDAFLFDPPYSPRQISECYAGFGLKASQQNTQSSFYTRVKDAFAPKIKVGGIAVSCCWNSVGFGKNRGFEQREILLVCHGGAHNDTIVVVEERVK